MRNSVDMLSSKRNLKPHGPLFLSNAFLGVALAFPLGILSALAGSVALFGTILPISILFAIVCPVIVPLIALSGVLLASWLLVRCVVRALISTCTMVVKLVAADALPARALHILLQGHAVAYMGLYAVFILSGGLESHPPKTASPKSHPAPPRSTRAHLFIPDLPRSMPAWPPTPPASNPSYTPTRSPSTEASFRLYTPVDEPTRSSLVLLSNMLDKLGADELDIVASHVEILKKGRSSPTLI